MTQPFLRLFGPRHDGEPQHTIARAVEDLKAKTGVHHTTWHLDQSRWDVDLDAGTITFVNPRDWKIVVLVQVIGTFNTQDRTWLWGWDHPSVPRQLAEHARAVRAFGAKYRLERYTTRKIVASEAEAWQFTALACYLAGAQGGYRGPTGPTRVFMTFGQVTISKS